MTGNIIFGIYKRDKADDKMYIRIGELPPLSVKRITDETRAMKQYIGYFPKPFSWKTGTEGRTVTINGHFGDRSYPFLSNMFQVMHAIHAGKFLKVESVTEDCPEMSLNSLWMLDGLATERDAKTAGFLYVNLTLFGVQKKDGGWIW